MLLKLLYHHTTPSMFVDSTSVFWGIFFIQLTGETIHKVFIPKARGRTIGDIERGQNNSTNEKQNVNLGPPSGSENGKITFEAKGPMTRRCRRTCSIAATALATSDWCWTASIQMKASSELHHSVFEAGLYPTDHRRRHKLPHCLACSITNIKHIADGWC